MCGVVLNYEDCLPGFLMICMVCEMEHFLAIIIPVKRKRALNERILGERKMFYH
jgi:hypothetical protein